MPVGPAHTWAVFALSNVHQVYYNIMFNNDTVLNNLTVLSNVTMVAIISNNVIMLPRSTVLVPWHCAQQGNQDIMFRGICLTTLHCWVV